MRTIVPMKGVVEQLPPDDGAWACELKWDGMRLLFHCEDGRVVMRSASGRDTTTAFPELAPLAERLPSGTVLDGEAIVMADDGPSFRALQHRIHVDRPTPALVERLPVKFVVFDLLWFAGNDIRTLPLLRRRDALDQTLETGPSWLLSRVSEGSAAELFDVAVANSLEGVVCKRLDSPYTAGRSTQWRKIKVRPRTDMVIGGWMGGTGTLANTIGSVVVGVYESGTFQCAGSVGSGLTDADRRFLGDRFRARPDSPFTNSDLILDRTDKPIHWVEPEIVAEIGFARWDDGQSLWQPTFHGIRPDGDPHQTAYRL